MRGGILLWMQKGYPIIGKRFNSIDNGATSMILAPTKMPLMLSRIVSMRLTVCHAKES